MTIVWPSDAITGGNLLSASGGEWPNGPDPDYLKTDEAASYTRLSVPTLERKRLLGDGPPFVKAGKSVIYRRVDLDAWLASRLVRSTSEPVAVR